MPVDQLKERAGCLEVPEVSEEEQITGAIVKATDAINGRAAAVKLLMSAHKQVADYTHLKSKHIFGKSRAIEADNCTPLINFSMKVSIQEMLLKICPVLAAMAITYFVDSLTGLF